MTRAQQHAAARLRQAADRLEPTLRRQVHRALLALQDTVRLDRLERALATGQSFAIHDLSVALPARLQAAVRTLARAFRNGSLVGQQALIVAGFPLRFDVANPFAVAAARESAARFVTAVTSETRSAVRTVVSRAFTEGIPPREAAQLIRPLIGLTERQAVAVLKHRGHLIATGMSRTAAARSAARYAARLLAQRALLIARTEIMTASNAGELSAWREAQRLGVLGRSDKEWIVAHDDRLCRFCRPMDGVKVPLGARFNTPFGVIDGPPMHPNCRCTLGVVPAVASRRRAA